MPVDLENINYKDAFMKLLTANVRGVFFQKELDFGCYPLHFAACSNDRRIFDLVLTYSVRVLGPAVRRVVTIATIGIMHENNSYHIVKIICVSILNLFVLYSSAIFDNETVGCVHARQSRQYAASPVRTAPVE